MTKEAVPFPCPSGKQPSGPMVCKICASRNNVSWHCLRGQWECATHQFALNERDGIPSKSGLISPPKKAAV